MRLVFVSDVHPDTPHISAVRLWAFARELAVRGHHVLFITQRRDATPEPAQRDSGLATRLAAHDWLQPFLHELGVPQHLSRDAPLRHVPSFIRRMQTAWNLLVHGGPRWRWSDAVAASAQECVGAFRPDLVWTTFGHTGNAISARHLARAATCPWILDIKDNWELYIPNGLRHLMAWRTRGWAALTANAEFTRIMARKWQSQDATVIYSGVADEFLLAQHDTLPSHDPLAINFVGGLYDAGRTRTMLGGVADWMSQLTDAQRARVRIRYFGGDTQLFADAARDVVEARNLESHGYVGLGELAQFCRSAVANLYVRHDGGFHHKLLELLACGRPTVVYPGESGESRVLAQRTGGALVEAATRQAVAEALARLAGNPLGERRAAPAHKADTFPFTWSALAADLETVFASVLEGRK